MIFRFAQQCGPLALDPDPVIVIMTHDCDRARGVVVAGVCSV